MFAANSQTYDSRGRIGANSLVGDYTYSSATAYRHKQTALNAAGTANYTGHFVQQAVYNNFKQPVEIAEPGRDKYTFQYSSFNQRAQMDWGRTQSGGVWSAARYSRHYSGDGSMEITEDAATGTTTFTCYIGGDAYTAPLMYRAVQGTGAVAEYLYLHRDYLGSIVAITDVNGVVKEKRQYDAWGKVVKLQDGSGVNLPAFVYTDRGYTGHEHLQGVSLVHMNGRLYDPVLHRFLMPDNFVQDPFNTQNYNRYAYVNFNPLSWVDWAGEQAEDPKYVTMEDLTVIAPKKAKNYVHIPTFGESPFSGGLGNLDYLPSGGGGRGGGAQSGGGGNSSGTLAKKVNTGIGAFDVGQGAKGALIKYAAKSSPAINDLKYVKGLKVLGGATFGVSSVISGGLMVNYYRNGGTEHSVWMKTALDVGMGYVGFLGPIGFGVSATYFLLDAGGTFQGWGDPLLTPKNKSSR